MLHAADELGEPAGEVDRAAVDVVERQHALDELAALLGHRDANQHPVEASPPRTGWERSELVRLTVRGIEPPADPALGDPVLHPRQVIVVETEAAAHRLTTSQVEQLRGGRALVGEREQLADDAEHGIGLPERAVGEPDAQVGRFVAPRVHVRLLIVFAVASGAERRLDQRRERLDVGAHHDHVARLERRVVLE